MKNRKDKKDFKLYLDSLSCVDDMTNDEAGELLKAFISFWREEEINISRGVGFAFKIFEAQFERDWEAYAKTCKARAEAGSLGGKQKLANASKCKQKLANASKCKQSLAKVADTDTDTDKDTDMINKEINKEKTPREKTIEFFSSAEFQKLYSEQVSIAKKIQPDKALFLVSEFVSYWTELTPNGKKQRWEMQKTFEVPKRFTTWFANAEKFSPKEKEKITFNL